MKLNIFIITIIIVISTWVLFSLETNAQIVKVDKLGNVKYVKFNSLDEAARRESPSSSSDFFYNTLGLMNNNMFMLENRLERSDGSFYEIHKQYYDSIAVEGGLYILHFNNNRLVKANGHYINVNSLNTSPKLTPLEACISYAKHLEIPDSVALKFVHGLVIAEIQSVLLNDTSNFSKLCYKIDILNFDDNGETGYIDAHTGEVHKTASRLTNRVTGTFSTLYSGTKTADTEYYNSTYNLFDSSRNLDIHTWDMNNSYYNTYSSNRVEFTDANNTWTAGEHSSNNDQMALDIHWAFQEIYDYFYDEHDGFESFDGDNYDIDAYVHCTFPDGSGGTTKDNAAFGWFANGYQAFFFGDGETIFKPLASFDAVSHEYAHGITRNFTGLEIDWSVESSINEGLSDIWGAIIENAVNPGKDCWKIGEEVMDNGDDCLRNLEYPESADSYTKMADTYGDNTYTSGTFYAKSGVMSHWFYLLSEGGEGTNDNDDDYLVYELGIDNSAMIVFEGHTGHFANVDTYSEARTAMVDASDQVFGANSMQSLQVANAWYAVGVGSQPAQVTLSGPSLVCNSGSVFTANNAPTGSTISWSTSTHMEVYSGGSTTTPTIKAKTANTKGLGWVQPNFTSNGYTVSGPKKIVWVGAPVVDEMIFTNGTEEEGFLCTSNDENEVEFPFAHSYNYFDIRVSNISGTQVLFSKREYYGTSTDLNYPSLSADFYLVGVQGNNSCGTGTWNDTEVEWLDCSSMEGMYFLSLAPNPVSTETEIEIMRNDGEPIDQNINWRFEVYDLSMNLKLKSEKIYSTKAKVSTYLWKEGIYFIRAYVDDEIVTKEVIKSSR